MQPYSFIPFPELSTARLLLRRIRDADTPALFFLRSDPAVLKYIGKEPAESLAEVSAFFERINGDIDSGNSILWGIALREDPGTVIGTICFWNLQPAHYQGEIGFVLHPDHWRKGIMKEAIHAVLDFGFGPMHLHRVEARLHPDNSASAAVLEATGFLKEGHLREDFFFRDRFHDTLVYAQLNNET